MKISAKIGFGLLVILWIWLAWGVLTGGFTLYNLLIVAISGIIILVPVWRKLHKHEDRSHRQP